MTENQLRYEDFQSVTWKRLSAELLDRLQALRELNDGRHDPIKTAEIRSSISEVKRLLALRTERSAGSSADPFSGASEPAANTANDD